MRILLISLFITSLSAILGGCGFVGFPGVYKIDVEQGNIVTQEMADQLEHGMSKRQVRFILGTPLLEDTFDQNRWDYVYVKRNGPNILSESQLTVVFEGENLVDVSGDFDVPAFGGEMDAPAADEASPAPDAPAEPPADDTTDAG